MRYSAFLILLLFSLPSLAVARGGFVGHSSGPVARSAPVSRQIIHHQPIYHAPMQHRAIHDPSQRAPAVVRHPYSISPTIHGGRSRIFANPVRREVTRHVRFHGGLLALPALVTLGAPVILDVPSIGELSVSEATYTTLYPLLSSDDEAERERAYVQLQEQIERDPESLIRGANEIPAGPPTSRDSCPDCPDYAEILPICQPAGCDTSETLFNDSRNPRYLIPERTRRSR
jgi:hypothetical protein